MNVGLTGLCARSIPKCLAVAGALIALGASPALAATHVWQGPASGGLWSNAANWTNGLPTTGEPGGTIVQFNGSTSTTMNIAGLTVDQIHFAGTANTILASGSTALGVSGSVLLNNILDDAGGNSVAAPLTLSGSTVFAAVTTGTLTLSGSIGGSDGLHVNGSGAGGVTLSGTSNTYTGTTTVAAGTLEPELQRLQYGRHRPHDRGRALRRQRRDASSCCSHSRSPIPPISRSRTAARST